MKKFYDRVNYNVEIPNKRFFDERLLKRKSVRIKFKLHYNCNDTSIELINLLSKNCIKNQAKNKT